jgi:hypothetical protein
MSYKVVQEDVIMCPCSSPSLDDILTIQWGFSLLSNKILSSYITEIRQDYRNYNLFRSSSFNRLFLTKGFGYPVSGDTYLN